MADLYIQEYSVFGSSALNDLAYDAIEPIFEPTQLTVSRAAQSTVQDVMIMQKTSGALARTYCDVDSAAVYGNHPARVCDKKKVDLNTSSSQWTGLSQIQKKTIIAHEFGHNLGLRHSNHSEYGINWTTGAYELSNHPNPTQTVMWTPDATLWNGAFQLHQHDVDHINAKY